MGGRNGGPRLPKRRVGPGAGEVLKAPGDESQASQTFTQLSEGHSAFRGFVRQPSDCPRRPALRDAELETAEVEEVADPLTPPRTFSHFIGVPKT